MQQSRELGRKDKNRISFCEKNPDDQAVYGKYGTSVGDLVLIKAGFVTKAKVKWHGIGNYTHPYILERGEEKLSAPDSASESEAEDVERRYFSLFRDNACDIYVDFREKSIYLHQKSTNGDNMKPINRIKVLLVEKQKTGK